jgi:exonuclease SbcC
VEPITLNLINFLSYHEESIDLTPITCGALTGDNGAGKSSLLDAITFSLFGMGTKGAAKEFDNYVTKGESECRVEMQFRLNGDTYLVVRGRSIKRNKSTLEFFILAPDADCNDYWRPLSAKNLTDTQQIIEDTLRMDYKTFTASSLILQGQADAFTANMTDAERKEALARILGLDIWDRMQEKAREKVRELKGTAQAGETRQAQLTCVVSAKVETLCLKTQEESTIGQWVKDIEEAQTTAVTLESMLQQKPAIQRQISENAEEARKRQGSLRDAEREYQELTATERNANGYLDGLLQTITRKNEIEQAVQEEAAIALEVAAHEKRAQEYMRLSAEASDLEHKVTSFDKLAQTNISSLEAQIETNQSYASTLDRVPCNGATKDSCPLLSSAKKAAAQIKESEKQLEEWHGKKNPAVALWQQKVKERDAASYDARAHQAAKECLVTVKRISALKSQLDVATARVTDTETSIKDIQERRKKLAETGRQLKHEIADLTARADQLRQELDALTPIAQDLAEVQNRVRTLRQQESEKQVLIGRLEQKLENIAAAETELAELERKMKDAREQLRVYELLDQACGKKSGVPALIVENAVPEIERLTNEMLGRMMSGRLAVRLDTQAEGKSTGTMQEVLRITVLDGGSERPYQTYSGAERFMVDLAIRVALSKFLAHRAGAEIGLFVLDEGLGACDQTNRQAVMEAIQTVAQEFSKTLVITHIAELQDALPQRIKVTKGPDGSKVRVV